MLVCLLVTISAICEVSNLCNVLTVKDLYQRLLLNQKYVVIYVISDIYGIVTQLLFCVAI